MSTSLVISHKFLYVVFTFSLKSQYFLISFLISFLTYWLFKSVLFNFHIFVNFLHFLLLLISNLISLWLDSILCMVSDLLNLVRLVLWPSIWSSLENVLCMLEINVCSVVIWCSVLFMSLRFSCFIVLFQFLFPF